MLVVLGALAVLVLVAVLAVRSVDSPSTLLWSEDFDGAAGSLPDPTRWSIDVGGTGWGNEELQRYTDSPDNVQLDGDGHLAITALPDTSGASCWYGPCRYTSARITTLGHYDVRYGRLEARMKLVSGQGIWPAFWTAGSNIEQVGWPAAGEIDVMEHLGSEPYRVHGALHGPDYDTLSDFDLPDGEAVADDFHTYAVEWNADSISWLVDGHRYHVEQLGDRGQPGAAFGLPHYLLLNLAVGGRWPGAPDPALTFPRTMLVDWVRVYAL